MCDGKNDCGADSDEGSVHICVSFCAMRCRGRAGKVGPLSADRSSLDICVQNKLVWFNVQVVTLIKNSHATTTNAFHGG